MNLISLDFETYYDRDFSLSKMTTEEYIRDDTPLPEGFKFVKGALDSLKRFPGQRYCEYEMGLTENLDPCGFKAEDVWFRGIADLLIIDAIIVG